MISPHKASPAYLESNGYEFYAWEMDLYRDRMVGPFDFAVRNGKPHCVPTWVWDELHRVAERHGADIVNLDKVVPLN